MPFLGTRLVPQSIVLGLSFSSHTVPDYLSLLYYLGALACVFLAIPFAIASLVFSTENNGRSALVLAIGVAVICCFFMIVPG